MSHDSSINEMASFSRLIGDRELMSRVNAVKAVSFDFFDTLFSRPLEKPEDVFDLIGLKFEIPDFREQRRRAQAEAFQRMHRKGRKEITLGCIYECFKHERVASRELMSAEYSLELGLIHPIPEMHELMRFIMSEGKTVVITSDMYFTEEFFREALKPFGLSHIPLFISASCNATKRDSGELFDVVADVLRLPVKDILHIGDNLLADVKRPTEKGMQAYHYVREFSAEPKKALSLATSLGGGMVRAFAPELFERRFAELGFVYGGPATLGFLNWIEEKAAEDAVDHLLFLSRDGFVMEKLARVSLAKKLPPFHYFMGSRTAFMLASITPENFNTYIPYLLSGSDGLAPCELFERLGVSPPSERVLKNLGLGNEVRVSASMNTKLATFLYAFRWEILKVCQRNRRALYQYLLNLGIKSGDRVAVVDVGWSGSSQEAFELATSPLMDLSVFGYYFCLTDSTACRERNSRQRMSSLISDKSVPLDKLKKLYTNRVAVELFFSAPHASVIGWDVNGNEIVPVTDVGRGVGDDLSNSVGDIVHGIELFVENYKNLQNRLGIKLAPMQLACSVMDLINDERAIDAVGKIHNFDAWGSSRYHALKLNNYD